MAEYPTEPAFFPVLGATEARKLIFDFSADLNSLTLTGTPTITFAVLPNQPLANSDPTPSDIANGSAQFDVTNTQVIVPVDGTLGVAGNDYVITVTCATSDSKVRMTLAGILPIR